LKPSQNSLIHADILREIHADIAATLGIDLSKECAKALRILETRGLAALNDWFGLRLAFVENGLRPKSPEYSQLFELCGPFEKDDERSVSHAEATAFACARQLLHLFRKTSDAPCLQTEEEALAAFKERQASHEIPLSTDQYQLAEEISKELFAILDDCNVSDLVCDVGPGASFEKRPHADRVLKHDARYSSIAFYGSEPEEVGRLSRWCAVPKTYKSHRLIFIEPSSRMLVQKALMSWLYDQAATYPLKSHCNFEDQSFQHRRMRRDDACTIDLSDASDHIDRRVVWRAFRRHPRLRALLFGTRSIACDNGMRFTAYSTMGNATTFPVMTYILTAVCRIAISQVRAREPREGRRMRLHAAVFGDDIVCSEVLAGSVRCVLGSLGLRVNAVKSYTRKNFKESCGLDLYGRYDVTPIKLKNLVDINPTTHSRWLAYANSLFQRGFWRASDVLVSHILSRYPKTAFGPIGTPDCIWSFTIPEPEGMWDRDYQRYVPWTPRSRRVATQSYDCEAMLDYALAHGRRVVTTLADDRREEIPFGFRAQAG
jgi:hypothetical protein